MGAGSPSEDDDDDGPPRRLEECYELAEVLGTGGFSVVRRAVARGGGGGEVAVKTLRKRGAHAEAAAMVENEVVVMAVVVERVSPHANVIHLRDVFEDAADVHLVLELCSGGELFDRIASQERYSEAGAAAVIRQLTAGLASLHAAGIVHGDLKPENCLFLTPDEAAPLKIMDFGLSQIEGATRPLAGLFGSIDYVPPEALRQRRLGPASDMWSLGVILYILLCGYPPFHARSNKEKQQLIQTASFDFDEKTWKSVSPSAKQLIEGLLTLDASQRPSAAELCQEPSSAGACTAWQLLLHPWVTGQVANQEPVEEDIFRRLISFNARRKFRAAAYASIVSNQFMLRTKQLRSLMGSEGLSSGELKMLHSQFKRLAGDGTSLTLPAFQQVLQGMQMGSLTPIAHRIFDIFDANSDGTVDMREIVCGFASLKKSEGEEALKFCFKMYDLDDSGHISKEELACMLRALPCEFLPSNITEQGELDDLFDRMDANSDGRLSFEEFRAGLHSDKYILDALLQTARGISPSAKEKASTSAKPQMSCR
eukprot:SM000008S22292  [mRNA]  locus=s8:906225:908940:+ [translate_table: standard]